MRSANFDKIIPVVEWDGGEEDDELKNLIAYLYELFGLKTKLQRDQLQEQTFKLNQIYQNVQEYSYMAKIVKKVADSGLVTPHEDENIPSSSIVSHDWSPSGQSGGLGEGLIQPSSLAESPFIYNRSAPK